MNKDNYLDKKIPEGSGEPENFVYPWFYCRYNCGHLEWWRPVDNWWVEQDKDKEWIEKTEKELF